MDKLKNNIPHVIIFLLFGIALGTISKYLDTVSVVDKNWLTIILHYFAALFTRLGVWVFIATLIAAYCKTPIRAAIHTFVFFIGMLISYYVYSAYLFGVFPTKYFIAWGSLALISPLLAIIAWKAKNNVRLAYILPALPMGLMMSLSFGMGLFYMYLNHIEELMMYVVLCVVFYKNPKQLAILVALSICVGFMVELLSPFHF
ncbi:hypothetical protein [Paenibacillus dakarensis]|uniref:hypothetical protein n=1 Tax=Paenibacillus dakarensis TaxID=1527293 RepID=UPI0006D54D98|nr:hypothetical protein [Paenibacillus dakarensis]